MLSASNSALTVPTVGTGSKVKKTSPHPAGTVTGAGVAAKRAVSTSVGGAASRSRSTSVMPAPHDADKATDKKVANEEPEEEAVVDDKLYCICKTKYDEDRVMIACDRSVYDNAKRVDAYSLPLCLVALGVMSGITLSV